MKQQERIEFINQLGQDGADKAGQNLLEGQYGGEFRKLAQEWLEDHQKTIPEKGFRLSRRQLVVAIIAVIVALLGIILTKLKGGG